MATVKVSFNLPEPVVAALKQLARDRNTTVTEVVRNSISNEMFLDRQVRTSRNKVLIETPDRKFREVVFPDVLRPTV